MKKFVLKKMYLSFAASAVLLAIISGYFSVSHYYQHKGELLRDQFTQQKAFVNDFKQTIYSLSALLQQGASIIHRYVINHPSAPSQQPYYEFDAIDKATMIHSINLIEPNRLQLIDTDIDQHPSGVLRHHQEVIEPILNSLIDNRFIVSATAISMKETEFSYFSIGREEHQNELFDWILQNKASLVEAKTTKSLVYPPSIRSETEYTFQNYLLMPVITTKNGFLILSVKFKEFLGYESQSSIDAANFIAWDQNTGLTLATNVEREQVGYNHVFFPSRYLPVALQPLIQPGPESANEDIRIIAENSETLSLLSPSWLAYRSKITGTPYFVIFYVDASDVILDVWVHGAEYGLMLFSGSMLVLLFVFALITWKLGYPTSNLITHIEEQSSLYDSNNKLAVKGWERWFEKISLSFKDNRKLLQSLMEKNKQLDDKVQQRTRALQSETISKDRNIALNSAIMNSIPDMIYYKNLDGGYLGCNSAFEYFAQTSEAELVARTAEEVFDEALAEELNKYDFQVLKSKRPFTGKSWHRFPNDDERLINWLIAPIINREGDVLGLIGLGRDVTQQEESLTKIEQAKENAVKANAAKSEFIANMSHEIRTPMNAVMGMIELMQSSSPSPIQSSYLNIAQSSSRHLISVINDILDFSKVSADKIELHREIFSVSEVFDISFANSLPEAMNKGLKLDICLPADFPEYFVGDKVRINQIFTNLIGNATKFTEQGGITLSAKVLPNTGKVQTIEFVVSDTGVGIPKDKQEAVFEAFTQADSSITREFGGTGLGLTIVYELVQLMGGKTKLYSKEGEGTEFTITLPLERVEEQPELQSITKQWLICEQGHWISQAIAQKLSIMSQSYNFVEPEELLAHSLDGVDVLAIRLEALEAFDDKMMSHLNKNNVAVQPIVYQMTQAASQMLEQVPYYPILPVPFSSRSLLFNQLQSVVNEEVTETIEEKLLQGRKILIIEDNEVNRQVLQLILNNAGAYVECANDGEMGLKQASKHKYDAVVLDVQMPVMDGLTCCRKLRQLEHYKHAPIIAMTAHSSSEDMSKSKSAGVDVHLSKPIEKERLLTTLSALFGGKALTGHFQTSCEEEADNAVELDIAFLANQFSGNMDAVRTILTRFCETKRSEITYISEHWRDIEKSILKANLHNIKGMLGSIGAVKGQKLTQMLELAIDDEVRFELVHDQWRKAMAGLFEQVNSVINPD